MVAHLLPTEKIVTLDPVFLAAVTKAFPWLGGWVPIETSQIVKTREPLVYRGHTVSLEVSPPPVPVPLVDRLPQTVIKANYFYPCLDTHGLWQPTHIWGGPLHCRAWHQSGEIGWQAVLENLTLADEGLVVRYLSKVTDSAKYVLYFWGPHPDVTAAVAELRHMVR